jgi:hypothetical protein
VSRRPLRSLDDRRPDQDFVLARLAVALDLALLEARRREQAADLLHVGFLGELQRELRSAGEIDAQVQLLDEEDGYQPERHDAEREDDPELPVLHEIDVRVAEKVHLRSLAFRSRRRGV